MVGRGAAHRFKIHCRRRGAFYMRPCSYAPVQSYGKYRGRIWNPPLRFCFGL